MKDCYLFQRAVECHRASPCAGSQIGFHCVGGCGCSQNFIATPSDFRGSHGCNDIFGASTFHGGSSSCDGNDLRFTDITCNRDIEVGRISPCAASGIGQDNRLRNQENVGRHRNTAALHIESGTRWIPSAQW